MTEFVAGDRVRAIDGPPINRQLRGKAGTVVGPLEGSFQGRLWVRMDDVKSSDERGWKFSPESLIPIDPVPTDEEIAALFGVAKLPEPCSHCQGTGFATGGSA